MSESNTQNPQTGQRTIGTDPQVDQGTTDQGTIGAASPQPDAGRTLRNPDEWATADEPMTEAQKSYLDTLAREAGEQLPADLTKAEASKHIDRLQKGNPRVNQ